MTPAQAPDFDLDPPAERRRLRSKKHCDQKECGRIPRAEKFRVPSQKYPVDPFAYVTKGTTLQDEIIWKMAGGLQMIPY